MEFFNIFKHNIKWRFQTPISLIITLIQPLIWLLIYGNISKNNIMGSYKGQYLEYILPGILILVIFSSSGNSGIINYIMKNNGSFFRIQISPIKRSSIILGHIFDSTIFSFIEILMIFIVSFFLSTHLKISLFNISLIIFELFLVIFFVANLSYSISIIVPDENIFFIIITTFVLPIFFTSTALIPYENISESFKIPVLINPFTHVINSVRNLLLEDHINWNNFFLVIIIMLVLCTLSFLFSLLNLKRINNY